MRTFTLLATTLILFVCQMSFGLEMDVGTSAKDCASRMAKEIIQSSNYKDLKITKLEVSRGAILETMVDPKLNYFWFKAVDQNSNTYTGNLYVDFSDQNRELPAAEKPETYKACELSKCNRGPDFVMANVNGTPLIKIKACSPSSSIW